MVPRGHIEQAVWHSSEDSRVDVRFGVSTGSEPWLKLKRITVKMGPKWAFSKGRNSMLRLWALLRVGTWRPFPLGLGGIIHRRRLSKRVSLDPVPDGMLSSGIDLRPPWLVRVGDRAASSSFPSLPLLLHSFDASPRWPSTFTAGGVSH